MKIIDALNPRFRFRDAITGHFVTRMHALLNPRTTVRERITPKESAK